MTSQPFFAAGDAPVMLIYVFASAFFLARLGVGAFLPT